MKLPRKVKGKPGPRSPQRRPRMILHLEAECWRTIRRAALVMSESLGHTVTRNDTVNFLLTSPSGPALLKRALESDAHVSPVHMPRGNRFMRGARPIGWDEERGK